MASFTHYALRRTAEDLKRLRQASAVIGSADPVTALRWLDCDPNAIHDEAKRVHNGKEKAGKAKVEIDTVNRDLQESWTGEGQASFSEFLRLITSVHTKVLDRCEDTSSAGHAVAHRLDGEASAAASDAQRIAQAAGKSVEIVAGGHTGHPHYADAKKDVNDACREIVSMVKRKTGEIAEARRELRGLTKN